ncbi:DUF2530 domain-containing protein [Mycolicibacterium vaccae]|nr:DUF2530 domain-containing protein [Mycolicibacterium vaccae]
MSEPDSTPELPQLPDSLLEVWPVIGSARWAGSPRWWPRSSYRSWSTGDRWTLAGLAVGLLGTGIFMWQRDAVRRGAAGSPNRAEVSRTTMTSPRHRQDIARTSLKPLGD